MVGIHILIGIGEALVTMATLAFVRVSRPDLLALRDARAASAAA
jgi:cobalt/nickel transport system permease protein